MAVPGHTSPGHTSPRSKLDQVHVTRVLYGCLLTEEEFELGSSSWKHCEPLVPPVEFDDDDSPEQEFSMEQH